jgi:hypothetical protein
MTTKKAVAKTTKPKPVLPKIGEIGFKFKVDAEIIDIDFSEDCEEGVPYLVSVNLGEDNIEYWFNLEELKAEIAKYDPKAKKAAKAQAIKDAEALVVKLKKELEEM